jgi:threonine dehydrogenase-like Zn-dependent dehydrogenase
MTGRVASETMTALEFRHEIGRYLASRVAFAASPRAWSAHLAPLHLVRLPRPRAEREGWSTLNVRLSGICGSDLSMMTGRDSLYLEPEATYPFSPGHEIVGDCNGRRVAVCPVLGCRARGLDVCASCAAGWDGFCERRTAGWPSHGLATGFNRDTGGGWAEACLVHESQLWELPPAVDDRDALLLDPACAALAALLRTRETAGERTLVLGGGTIGVLVAHLHRALRLSGDCELLVRYEHQRRFAEGLGIATTIVRGEGPFRAWAESRGVGMQRVPAYGHAYRGVFDRVIDAAGTQESFAWATAAVRARGCVVLLTSPASLQSFDPTPLWYREVTVQGIYQYGPVPWEGCDVHPYRVLLPMLERGALRLADYVTHQFPLERFVDAFRASVRRTESGAVKVAFRPERAT